MKKGEKKRKAKSSKRELKAARTRNLFPARAALDFKRRAAATVALVEDVEAEDGEGYVPEKEPERTAREVQATDQSTSKKRSERKRKHEHNDEPPMHAFFGIPAEAPEVAPAEAVPPDAAPTLAAPTLAAQGQAAGARGRGGAEATTQKGEEEAGRAWR